MGVGNMAEGKSTAASLQLLGGALCLDFANTVGNHKAGEPSEHLAGYADWIAWSQHAGALTPTQARRLLAESARYPIESKEAFKRATELRETIYRIFGSIAENASPKSADLERLNEALARGLVHSRVVATPEGFRWDWTDETALDRMEWLVARSAADLLTSGDLDRVRQCGDAECGWLFIDTSRNRSRRWCDMNDCGNRAKARRHYRRLRGIE
jgi:predicted RNA-binding Zn ribbon-like protein